MIGFSLNLPADRRLDLSLVKKRRSNQKSLTTNLREIKNVRKGNKFSRYFRYIFEHKNIKKVFGFNLFALVIASSLFPQSNISDNQLAEETQLETPIILTTEKSIQYPLKNISITQSYRLYHPGIDYDALTGDPVYPFMKGYVEAVSYSRYAYGNAILINHGEGLSSLYAHLSKIDVSSGQPVTLETKIGEVGATGYASGDHLHFEIRQNNYPVNPLSILP